MEYKNKLKCELYNDSMQGWKCYPIQKAQLIIADVPYNVGTNFYGSNPMWYEKGDNKNGESKQAWVYPLHTTCVREKLQSTGLESKYACCRRYGICIGILQRQATEVPQRRTA